MRRESIADTRQISTATDVEDTLSYVSAQSHAFGALLLILSAIMAIAMIATKRPAHGAHPLRGSRTPCRLANVGGHHCRYRPDRSGVCGTPAVALAVRAGGGRRAVIDEGPAE